MKRSKFIRQKEKERKSITDPKIRNHLENSNMTSDSENDEISKEKDDSKVTK